MAQITIIYWRDIPAQVIVKAGRASAKRELSERFQQAIDMAAMRSGARDTEAYLAEWHRGAPVSCGNDVDGEADATMSRLEAAYDQARLARLVANGGREGTP